MVPQRQIMGEIVDIRIVHTKPLPADRGPALGGIGDYLRPEGEKFFKGCCGAHGWRIGGCDGHDLGASRLIVDARYTGDLDGHVTSIKPSPSGE
jgi:hypothetical protein